MKRLIAFALAFLLLAGLAVGVSAQSGGAGFYDIQTSLRVWENLRVLGTSTLNGAVTLAGDATVGDALTVVGDASVGDDLTVTDNASVGNDLTVTDLAAVGRLQHTGVTTQTLTADLEITNTHSYLLISAAGNIGTSDIADCTLAKQGQVLAIENVSNTTITITDTATTMLSGNAVLAQWDNLTVFCDGTNWVEFAQVDN